MAASKSVTVYWRGI